MSSAVTFVHETRALAPLLMGDADHCRHRHRGMAQRMTLDLLRVDPLVRPI